MKKTLAIVLCVGLVLSTVAFAATDVASALKFYFNGSEKKLVNTPIVKDNRTYLPVREIAKLTGKYVHYDSATKGIYLLEDGVYRAYEIGKHGYVPEIKITISSGDITGVTYDEYIPQAKSADKEGYVKRMYDAKKVDIAQAMDTLEKKLLEVQDIEKVDTVTGATSTSNSFKTVVKAALEQAKDKETGKLKDGLYDPTGEEHYGYFPMVKLTIKDGKISAVDYDEYSTSVFVGAKSGDKAYIENFKKVRNLANLDLGASYKAWSKDFEEADSIEAMKLNDTADSVAGVTHSFHGFKELANKALMSGRYYKDGKYAAEQKEIGPTGWRYKVSFDVKSGKIANVVFDAYNKDGIAKTDPKIDYSAYTKKFGVTIGDQYKKLADSLVAAQTPSGVDKVAGATHSWADFRELVNEALAAGPIK